MHLVFAFGPPAVGKMTVGREICARTGYKLLHNHMTVEPVLDVFPFGSPPFSRLVNEFRRRILEEAVLALDGLVMTMVWGLDLEEDVVHGDGVTGFDLPHHDLGLGESFTDVGQGEPLVQRSPSGVSKFWGCRRFRRRGTARRRRGPG